MTQISLPTYTELSEALSEKDPDLHASQVHGLICGMLAANTKVHAWEEMVTGGHVDGAAHELLHDLYESSEHQLKEFMFEFQLLLPTEDNALPERAEGLSLWCQGFLTGLKASGVNVENHESEEISEAIADLIEIAKMDYEKVVENEEDEAAYMELVEFIRAAVILIYQNLRDQVSAQSPVPSNHLH